MPMYKKDYQAIARALHELRQRTARQALPTVVRHDLVAEALAEVLADDNPRFDRILFLEACETGKCKGMRSVAAESASPDLPICVKAMGCYCAGHARGTQAVDDVCDTRE